MSRRPGGEPQLAPDRNDSRSVERTTLADVLLRWMVPPNLPTIRQLGRERTTRTKYLARPLSAAIAQLKIRWRPGTSDRARPGHPPGHHVSPTLGANLSCAPPSGTLAHSVGAAHGLSETAVDKMRLDRLIDWGLTWRCTKVLTTVSKALSTAARSGPLVPYQGGWGLPGLVLGPNQLT